MNPRNPSSALFLTLLCMCTVVHAQTAWNPFGTDIPGEAHNDTWGSDLDVNHNGTVIAAVAYGNDDNGIFAGHVRSFEWNGTAWVQRGADIDGLGAWHQTSKAALDRSGTVLAVGNVVSMPSTDAAYVRIFDWNGSAWVLRGAPITGANDVSFASGLDISANGNTVAIGANLFNGVNGIRSGRTQVFDWNGVTWVQRGLNLDGQASDDFSGRVVKLSADGNTVAISATGSDAGGQQAGQVRVFEWNGAAWAQRGLDLNGSGHQVQFGSDISLSADGRRLAVGSPGRDTNFVDAGEVLVFDWNGAVWQQVGPSIRDGEAHLDNTGGSVSLNAAGDLLAVGGHEYTDTTGTARIYRLTNGVWQKQGADITGTNLGERFATAVALSDDGTTLVSSAPLWSNSAGQALGYIRTFKDSAPIFSDSFE